MNRFMMNVLGVMSLIGLANTAQAEVAFPNQKPTEVLQIKDALYGNQRQRCVVVWNQAPLLDDPRLPAKANMQVPFLGTIYWVGDTYTDANQQKYLLLVKRFDEKSATDYSIDVDGYLGWIREDYCLAFGKVLHPMRTPDGVFRKAMLVVPSTAVANVQETMRLITFHDRPDSQGKPHRSRGLFQVYYVYAESKIGDKPQMLFGTSPQLNLNEALANQVLGWISSDRICLWNTREAVEFYRNPEQDTTKPTTRSRPSLVFRQYADLEAYAAKPPPPGKLQAAIKKLDAEGKLILHQDAEETGLHFFQPRYPVVSDKESELLSGQPLSDDGRLRAYRIGVMGSVYDEQGKPVFRGNQSDVLRWELQQYRERLRKIQVMFVIDATFGMNDWLKSSRKSVIRMMDVVREQSAKGLTTPNVEFSINFYRDRQEVRGAKMFEGHPFTSQATDVLDLFDHATAIGGGEPLDAMLLGINRALFDESLKKPKFDPDATKILIVIGDDGNDPNDKENTIQSTIQNLLKVGGNNPINFFALSVGDQEQEVYRAFTDQAKAIAKGLLDPERKRREAGLKTEEEQEEVRRLFDQWERNSIVVERIVDENESADATTKATSAIELRFMRAIEEMNAKRSELEQLLNSAKDRTIPLDASSPLAERGKMVWGQRVRDELKTRIPGGDLAKLDAIRNGLQTFELGWALDYDPGEDELEDPQNVNRSIRVPQIRLMMLMERKSLQEMRSFLGDVMDEFDPMKLRETWERVLDKILADDLMKQKKDIKRPLDLLRTVINGVKFRGNESSVISYSFDQLADVKPSDLQAFNLAIRRNYLQIGDVLDNQRSTYFLDPTNPRNWRRKAVTPQKYWWGDDTSIEGNGLQAWVDRGIFP